MSIRLDAIETVGQGLKDWCQLSIPLFCVARFLSDRPIDWCLFWIGWKFLRSSITYLFSKKEKKHEQANHDGRRITKLYKKRCNVEGRTDMLTSLPCVVLSHMTCFLHPKDVLSFDSLLLQQYSIGMIHDKNEAGDSDEGRNKRMKEENQNHRRIGRRQCHNFDDVCHDIWKRLWYRDYGDVLLQWKVARAGFRNSLQLISSLRLESYDDDDDSWLEEQLSKRLDEMMTSKTTTTTTTNLMITTMKEFYFLFGECYIDYLLANKNTIDECLFGLNGHIFNFTSFAEYHPGLIDPILKECGGDATYFFEDIPHSTGARNIAQRLCLLVNRDVISNEYDNDDNNDNNSHSLTTSSRYCGLELVLSASSSISSSSSNDGNDCGDGNDKLKLRRLLRSSNTRPPTPSSSVSSICHRNNSNDNNHNNRTSRNWWMTHLLPRRREMRRPPTLLRIRHQFQQGKQHQEQQFLNRTMLSWLSSFRFWNSSSSSLQQNNNIESSLLSSSSMTRSYYDPFRQEWIRWDPNSPRN